MSDFLFQSPCAFLRSGHEEEIPNGIEDKCEFQSPCAFLRSGHWFNKYNLYIFHENVSIPLCISAVGS